MWNQRTHIHPKMAVKTDGSGGSGGDVPFNSVASVLRPGDEVPGR